ncbi:Hypothetical predicted protein [Paramuricea clavata]|uniref:Uncharacterized protein n=1 Tax=Paramuricea clavata TaxID=317549 RepID=A0A6S7KK34_PARCT|nr:Hypothetical predicted protein [Paramuricea clavata]
MQKIAKRIAKADWEKHRRDPDVEPLIHVKDELSVAEGLIFREQRIVLPEALQRKVVKVGHKLGHLGTTKTKQMLREKNWFPLMNSMIDTAIDQCYECRVTTKLRSSKRTNQSDKYSKQTMGYSINRPRGTVSGRSLQPCYD